MISAIESATQLNSCQVKDNKYISLPEHNIFIALSLNNGRGESLSISRNDEHCTKRLRHQTVTATKELRGLCIDKAC